MCIRDSFKASDVVSISLESIRAMDIDGITAQLMAVQNFNKVIVNAIDNSDVKIFCIALYRALAQGKHFTYRTAAAFVKAMGNISDKMCIRDRCWTAALWILIRLLTRRWSRSCWRKPNTCF